MFETSLFWKTAVSCLHFLHTYFYCFKDEGKVSIKIQFKFHTKAFKEMIKYSVGKNSTLNN